MGTKDFFKEQGDGTQVKIAVYCDYVETYLIKVLMQFGVCLIADLFCGPGKNGTNDGSPLILIEKAKRILESETLKKRHPDVHIYIIFNDANKENIKKLKSELSKLDIPNNIKIFDPQNLAFSELIKIKDIKDILKVDVPKFFFLDPFGYSVIELNEIEEIINLRRSEILLFLPTFLAYRFSGVKEKMPQKLKKFLDDFTTKDYKDIHTFNNSIKRKLAKDLKLEFVRPMPIDIGANKNTLFFLTRHIIGMILMNNIFLKYSYDGKSLPAVEIKKNKSYPMLFKKNKLETKDFKNVIIEFQKKLLQELDKRKKMFNDEIIKFTAIEGFRSRDADDLLKKLKRNEKIKVQYARKDKIRGFYVSDSRWNERLSLISIK